jgi:hypothetical protein
MKSSWLLEINYSTYRLPFTAWSSQTWVRPPGSSYSGIRSSLWLRAVNGLVGHLPLWRSLFFSCVSVIKTRSGIFFLNLVYKLQLLLYRIARIFVSRISPFFGFWMPWYKLCSSELRNPTLFQERCRWTETGRERIKEPGFQVSFVHSWSVQSAF